MADQKYASFDPEGFKESAGLFDNVDGVIKNFQFTDEPPNEGYTSEGSPLFAVLTLLLAGSGSEEERTVQQSYALGASAGQNWRVSEDGYSLIAIVDDPVMRKGSKFDYLMTSFKAAGVALGASLKPFIGLNAHWKRVADPERNFRKKTAKQQEREAKFGPPTTLLMAKLLSSGKATKGGSTTAAAPAPEGDVNERASQYLLEALNHAKDKTIQKARITLAVATIAKEDPARKEIAALVAKEEFLTGLADAGVISFDSSAKGQPISVAA